MMDSYDLLCTIKLAVKRKYVLVKRIIFVTVIFVLTLNIFYFFDWFTTRENIVKINEDILEYHKDLNWDRVKTLHYSKEHLYRLRLLSTYCRSKTSQVRRNELLNFKHAGPYSKHHVHIDHQSSLLQCQTPGVLNTKLLNEIFEVSKEVQLSEIIGKGELNSILRHYCKVLFVTHPFERLVNIYRSIFNENNVRIKEKLTEDILRFSRKNLTEIEYKNGKVIVLFTEFLNWIIKKNIYDEMWAPIYKLCSPCIIPYDFVVKKETIEKDLKDILKHFNPVNNIPNNLKISNEEVLNQETRVFFAKVPQYTIKLVIKHYQSDLSAFGYSVPKYIYHNQEDI